MAKGATILERMIEQSHTDEAPSPFPSEIIPCYSQGFFETGRSAVAQLDDPEEIVAFMKQYTQSIRENHDLSFEDAQKKADEIIGYCTGYVDDFHANIWFNALPNIKHPITGRKRPFCVSPERNVWLYITTENKDLRAHLETEIPELFKITGVSTEYHTDIGNANFIAFEFKQTDKSWMNNTELYLFSEGALMGLRSRVEKEYQTPFNAYLEILNT